MWRAELRGSRGRKRLYGGTSAATETTPQGKDTGLDVLRSSERSGGTLRIFPSIQAQQISCAVVEVQRDKGQWFGSGEISRVHMQRNGQKIDTASRRRWIFAELPKET